MWLSFGLAETIQAVLDVRASLLLRSDTIIGVNNVGGMTTPGVGPWVASAVAEGRLEPLDLYPRHFVGFYQTREVSEVRPKSSCVKPVRPVLNRGQRAAATRQSGVVH